MDADDGGTQWFHYIPTANSPTQNHWIQGCDLQNNNNNRNNNQTRRLTVRQTPLEAPVQWIVGSNSFSRSEDDACSDDADAAVIDDELQFVAQFVNNSRHRFIYNTNSSSLASMDVLEEADSFERPLVGTFNVDGLLQPLDVVGFGSGDPLISDFAAPVPLPNGNVLFVTKEWTLVQYSMMMDSDDGKPIVGEDRTHSSLSQHVEDVLIDASISYSPTNRVWAVYHGATVDRNIHGVLGDLHEGYRMTLLYWHEETQQVVAKEEGEDSSITLEGRSLVYEGLGPMWADLNDDGIDDLLTTISGNGRGAALRVYIMQRFQDDNDEEVIQFSPTVVTNRYIGLDDRWLHQLGVGPFGPNGETEIVEVRTPHLGKILRYFRLNLAEERFELVADTDPYTSHDIDSRNLDTVVFGDWNGDGIIELAITNGGQSQLVGLQRTDECGGRRGVLPIWSVFIPDELYSNLAVACSSSSMANGHVTNGNGTVPETIPCVNDTAKAARGEGGGVADIVFSTETSLFHLRWELMEMEGQTVCEATGGVQEEPLFQVGWWLALPILMGVVLLSYGIYQGFRRRNSCCQRAGDAIDGKEQHDEGGPSPIEQPKN